MQIIFRFILQQKLAEFQQNKLFNYYLVEIRITIHFKGT